MADQIMEIIEVTRPAPMIIQDLINFARSTHGMTFEQLQDDAYMVRAAGEYWDRQHGED